MPQVKFQHVVSFSSEDQKHKIENLLSGKGMWLCSPQNQSSNITADFQLERAVPVNFIDIGNYNCAMIRVDVGMSTWPSSQDFVSLLPTVVFMSPSDCRIEKNSKTVRMFKKDDLHKENVNKKWDRVRITCSQPFKKNVQFGLAFFKLYSPEVSSVENSLNSATSKISEEKKDEMMAIFSPHTSPPKLPESLQFLEHSRLNSNKSDSSGVSTDISKLSSPLSRGAKLVMARKQIANENNIKSDKKALELEALDFLLSLNLSRSDIHSLRVSHIRTEFESRRKLPLDVREKLIFKSIALDFSAERLKKFDLEDKEKGMCENTRTTLTKSPLDLQEKSKRDSPSLCRNSIALADSVVTKNSSKRKRYETIDVDELKPSSSAFSTFKSNSNIVLTDSDDEDAKFASTSRRETNNYSLKKKTSDKYGTFERTKQNQGSSNSSFIECPLCTDLFAQNEIQDHASTCEGNDRSESIEPMEECPVCGNMFEMSEIKTHAEECAERSFA